jgi:hypothetical protein
MFMTRAGSAGGARAGAPKIATRPECYARPDPNPLSTELVGLAAASDPRGRPRGGRVSAAFVPAGSAQYPTLSDVYRSI